MNDLDRVVLPFKWSEFSKWFSQYRQVAYSGTHGFLAINDTAFSAGHHRLEGISIVVELCFNDTFAREVYLCGFLADLEHQQLFEPFIGNPDSSDNCCFACRKLTVHPGVVEVHNLFIPEAGWVLPSIWRFLIQSLGLRPKGQVRMPDIVVFAIASEVPGPLLFGTLPFDYYGQAKRLKEELLLGEFFRQLHIDEHASESEIQRAYILHCRDSQMAVQTDASTAVTTQQQNQVNRLRQGYQLWTEKLQRQRETD